MAAVTAMLWAAGVGLAVAGMFVRLPLDMADLPGVLMGAGSGLAAHRAAGQVDRAYLEGWWGRGRYGRLRLVAPRSGRHVK